MTEYIPSTPDLLEQLAFAATETTDRKTPHLGRVYQYRGPLITHAELDRLQYLDRPDTDWPSLLENHSQVSPVTLRHITLNRYGIHLLIPWNQTTQAIADSSFTRLVWYDPDAGNLRTHQILDLRLDLPHGWQQIQTVGSPRSNFVILKKKLPAFDSQIHLYPLKGNLALYHFQTYGDGRQFQLNHTEQPDGRSELELVWAHNDDAVFVTFDASGRPADVHLQRADLLVHLEQLTHLNLPVTPSLLRDATQPEHTGTVRLPSNLQIATPLIHQIFPDSIPSDAWGINYEATLENYFTAARQAKPPDPQSAVVWQHEPLQPKY